MSGDWAHIDGLVLTPLSRRPTRLSTAAVDCILSWPVPAPQPSARPVTSAATVVVPTCDNFLLLKCCVTSLLLQTTAVPYELIVVDNGSRDETGAWLAAVAEVHPQLRVLTNAANDGFARATNRGLRAAVGDVLVLLNDDTMVSPRWLERLLDALGAPGVDLVGPVTNRAGNEAQIPTSYDTYGEFCAFDAARASAYRGQRRAMTMLTMFCLAMRRRVYETLGPLDERFAAGMFEDDDYAMRARTAGFEMACADDVVVHHFGATSISKASVAGEYGALFTTNRRRFEEKWQTVWTPHQYRTDPEYQGLAEKIRAAIVASTPPGAHVAVISKGDSKLLDLDERRSYHFPQQEDGTYTGFYPADDAAAIALLDSVRVRGAEFLAVPEPASWWLEHYPGLAAALGNPVTTREQVCRIFALQSPEPRRPRVDAGEADRA